MSEINEQRVCIKFCLKLGKNATKTYTMIKTAFGEYSLSRSVTFEWYKRFKDGRQSTDDDPRSGRPSTSRKDDVVEKIEEKVRNDRRLTFRELANEAGISIGSCHEILTENLQMKRVAAKFVPRLLTLEQKENRLTICQDFKNRCADVNSLKTLSLVTRRGFMDTIRKQSSSHHNGKKKFLLGQKKLAKLKSALKGQRFQDVEDIKANTAAELKAITLEQFQRTFQN
ncbi:hypothetical protein QTP88_010376 [Uroleucon formosanum]